MQSVQSFLFTSVVEQGLNLIGWYGLNNPIALRKAKIVLYTILAFLSAIGLRCKNCCIQSTLDISNRNTSQTTDITK